MEVNKTATALFQEQLLKYRISTELYKKLLRTWNDIVPDNYFNFDVVIFDDLKELDKKDFDSVEFLKTIPIKPLFCEFCKDNWIGKWPKSLDSLYNIVMVESMEEDIKNKTLMELNQEMIESAFKLVETIKKHTPEQTKEIDEFLINGGISKMIEKTKKRLMRF